MLFRAFIVSSKVCPGIGQSSPGQVQNPAIIGSYIDSKAIGRSVGETLMAFWLDTNDLRLPSYRQLLVVLKPPSGSIYFTMSGMMSPVESKHMPDKFSSVHSGKAFDEEY